MSYSFYKTSYIDYLLKANPVGKAP